MLGVQREVSFVLKIMAGMAILGMAAAGAAIAAPAAQGNPGLTLEIPPGGWVAGQVVTVPITVPSSVADPVNSVQVYLNFDAELLQVVHGGHPTVPLPRGISLPPLLVPRVRRERGQMCCETR